MGRVKDEHEKMMEELYRDTEYREWLNEQDQTYIQQQDNYYDDLALQIGRFCRDFRLTILRKTLKEVSSLDNPQTLSGFEFGRSTNIVHVAKYFNACTNIDQQLQFMKGITGLLIKLRGE